MNANNLTGSTASPMAIRPLTRGDYKTLWLSSLGGALEFYDFIIFVFFAPVIAQLFFPPDMPDWLRSVQTFGIFAAGYLARPLGGIIVAHYGDLLGRKRMFLLSVLLMSVPTLLMGVSPTYATAGVMAPVFLLILRILQGAAVGGEVPGAWVFVSEHVPEKHVGYACGTLTAGLTAGILLGSLVATAVHKNFGTHEITAYAWRIPFLLGGVFGLISVYLRRWLSETPVFVEMKQRRSLAAEIPLRAVLRDHRLAVVVAIVLTWMLSADIVVVILMTPQVLQKQFHLSAETALIANSAATLALGFGCITAGWIAGLVGPRRTIAVGAVALGACYYLLFREMAGHPGWLVPLYALSGFTVGVVAVIPFVMVSMFPAVVRFSGISFSYNLSYAVFGGLTPIAVSVIMKSSPHAPVLYVSALCVVGIACTPFIRTKPRDVALN
ncbi:L-Proline/Glycine betaine transporter ProP [Caballeronia glathei]|uniref:MFS transporter n=1 Tax=Caballeronia glathei TaxID=60547 RepID=A0A069PJ99_9BURK|nr:MFS transporter [Caballeronia glathei]KDR40452.1 MFS transporter [Caballeronia glathei]CDY77002.1 L-Proline/Glycine betaine transporter ProP [Caballeronia glathei]